MLGLKLIHVSKSGPRCPSIEQCRAISNHVKLDISMFILVSLEIIQVRAIYRRTCNLWVICLCDFSVGVHITKTCMSQDSTWSHPILNIRNTCPWDPVDMHSKVFSSSVYCVLGMVDCCDENIDIYHFTFAWFRRNDTKKIISTKDKNLFLIIHFMLTIFWREWMNNPIQVKQWDVFTYLCLTSTVVQLNDHWCRGMVE